MDFLHVLTELRGTGLHRHRRTFGSNSRDIAHPQKNIRFKDEKTRK